MTAQEALRLAIQQLTTAQCDNPRLDAEVLLMHTWNITRTQLFTRAHDLLPDDVQQHFNTRIERRCQREPVAYITGEKEFWSRSFHVTPEVLIPRPETEHLIEALLTLYPDRQAPYQFTDIGTGSGCIAITLACEFPNASLIATDISAPSLAIARSNAERHGVAHRIAFQQGDLYAALHPEQKEMDAILSNPPYVALSEMETLAAELAHEPRHALTDQADGLNLLRTLLHQAPSWLKEGGYLLVETGICGLPTHPNTMILDHLFHDLAGILRGGVYQRGKKHA